MIRVLIRGTNDVASAVAHRLFTGGHAVVLQGGPQPSVTRRGMAFADAVWDGRAVLAGVTAARVDDLADLAPLLTVHEVIPVVITELPAVLAAVRPDVLVDARMRKRARPESRRGMVPLTVGLGPNFVAGETVDLAVETAWGEDLGRVVARGPTFPLEGEPRPLAGHGRDRYVYAPAAGVFRTRCRIGDAVRAGDVIAHLDGAPLHAPLGGALRGLTRDGVPVAAGTKVIEVDPRGPDAAVTGIGERPGRIADGVLRALAAWRAGAVAEH